MTNTLTMNNFISSGDKMKTRNNKIQLWGIFVQFEYPENECVKQCQEAVCGDDEWKQGLIREVTSAGKIENILLTDTVFFVLVFCKYYLYLLQDIVLVLVPDVESDEPDHQERM